MWRARVKFELIYALGLVVDLVPCEVELNGSGDWLRDVVELLTDMLSLPLNYAHSFVANKGGIWELVVIVNSLFPPI